MAGKKILVVVVAVIILVAALLLTLTGRNDQEGKASMATLPDGSFLVQVRRPAFSGRPIWEVPRAIFGDGDRALKFTDTSQGAKVGAVGPDRLELSADDGWELVISGDGQGRVLADTHLAFTLKLFDREIRLNCRPGDPAVGRFTTNTRAGSDRLDGEFFLKLSQCKNAVSGKNTAGLPVFTLVGGFKGLPRSAGRVNTQ